MDASEFRQRYIDALPPVPPDLDLGLDEFITYPSGRVAKLPIPNEHKAFLTTSGMPSSAAPFLDFSNKPSTALMPVDGFPNTAIFGFNNYGDYICLDMDAAGAVVYYNHDNRMERVLMNSSLPLFAECLCAFAQFNATNDIDSFLDYVRRIDHPAAQPGCFWAIEAEEVRDSQ